MDEHMSQTDQEQQRKKEKVIQEWKEKKKERERKVESREWRRKMKEKRLGEKTQH